MYYDFKVKIPKVKGKIYERTIKGGVYINYEYDRIYIAFCAAEQTLVRLPADTRRRQRTAL